jgi:hypothetical protein
LVTASRSEISTALPEPAGVSTKPTDPETWAKTSEAVGMVVVVVVAGIVVVVVVVVVGVVVVVDAGLVVAVDVGVVVGTCGMASGTGLSDAAPVGSEHAPVNRAMTTMMGVKRMGRMDVSSVVDLQSSSGRAPRRGIGDSPDLGIRRLESPSRHCRPVGFR